jgi:hypothetical protein
MTFHPQITGGEEIPGNRNTTANVGFTLLYSLFIKAYTQEIEILAMLKRVSGYDTKKKISAEAHLLRKHINEVLEALHKTD